MIPDDITSGQRIAIIGYSCSGKSTLATALAQSNHLPVYPLDGLAHKHHTNWQRVSNEELIKQHDAIIAQPAWILEGNYQVCMQQRFLRAETVIILRLNRYLCAWRYLKRSWKNDATRPGKLPGAHAEFKWWLLKHILFNQPRNQLNYIAMLTEFKHIQVITIKSLQQYQTYTKLWCQPS